MFDEGFEDEAFGAHGGKDMLADVGFVFGAGLEEDLDREAGTGFAEHAESKDCGGEVLTASYHDNAGPRVNGRCQVLESVGGSSNML